MPVVEWNKTFEVGVKQFDDHHKHLFGLLNKTYDKCACGAGNDELAVILDELIDYASYHFAAEEQWMRTHKYPGLQQQSEEHEKFAVKIIELQCSFLDGKADLAIDVLQFLENWLLAHILTSDADYGEFAKTNQIGF